MSAPRRVVVLLGTDVHPFLRLVQWADDWAEQHPQDTVVVQFGYSDPPLRAEGVRLLSPQDLASLVASADVVVTHGGPGTMADARAAGHLPVLVPRDPSLGEHVDGHQLRFAAWADPKGLATVVRDKDAFDAAVADDRGAVDTSDQPVAETAERVGLLVTDLVAEQASRPWRVWARRLARLGTHQVEVSRDV